ncbi:hypothetical protein [Alkalicoccus chagannorensis]|uniref:hypothetical protein n=1 Tax=Alkalicoccus chagannorensis TaxID=427072 RepID=UPI0004130CB5|nr:hypothetical protein [Alkalicoccus chagannorensis]
MWTPETAFAALRDVYDEELMIEEKRKVMLDLQRQLEERLDDMALRHLMPPELDEQLSRYKISTFMSGDNIFQSMRHVFLIARGEPQGSRQETEAHLQRIYRTLFQPAARRNPVIPDSFWRTPLGTACLVADKGIEAAYPILDEVRAVQTEEKL